MKSDELRQRVSQISPFYRRRRNEFTKRERKTEEVELESIYLRVQEFLEIDVSKKNSRVT